MSAGRKITDARDARACLKAAKSAGMARGERTRRFVSSDADALTPAP